MTAAAVRGVAAAEGATAGTAAKTAASAAPKRAAGATTKKLPQAKSGLAHEYTEPAPAAAPAKPDSSRARAPGGGAAGGGSAGSSSGTAGSSSAAPSPGWSPSLPTSGGVVSDGASVALTLLVWCWFVLPWITGGPKKVKAVLMAKFLNRKPDGSWLP
jgi:hypothetical protein